MRPLSKLNVSVLTLFPELFPGPLGISVLGRALSNNLWNLQVIDIRKFATDKYKSIDDYSIGGGAGMIFKPDVLGAAIEDTKGRMKNNPRIVHLSPRGNVFNQKMARQLLSTTDLILICARFEGIDQRIIDYYKIEEISIGDYILTGGEVAAFAILESCIRLIPGVLGGDESIKDESFSPDTKYECLLEYDQYAKPVAWKGMHVPDVLLSGNHKSVQDWRFSNACKRTQERRPDLWELYMKRRKDD